ncbi:MAG: DUF4355 domain-containing protein, partial [Coriobacteriia bacterium]|nr:DUF4355 domain-containing protein [Coriobacteriia bacterium]
MIDETSPVEEPQTETDQGDKSGGATEKTFTQKDFDRLVSKRVNEVQNKADKAIKDAIAEYERISKLDAETREKEERAKNEAAIIERENKITLRENTIAAKDKLAELGIPISLAAFVV